MQYRTCPYCGAHLDPAERCACDKKEEDTPGDAGVPSKNAVVGTDSVILSPDRPAVNDDCFRLAELQRLSGAQAKDISEVIARRFPKFSRQIFTQCAAWWKYGCIPHPEIIRIIRSEYDLPPETGSAPTYSPQQEPEAAEGIAKLSQCKRVLQHLSDYGSITAREAMMEYDITHLSSRISELKQAGYDIRSVKETHNLFPVLPRRQQCCNGQNDDKKGQT